MSRVKHTGFTLIEVLLFLAVSGFILTGLLAGTGAGIARERYQDSVQHIAQLLREQYSAVMNTQIPMRESDGACYSPNLDDLISGGKIDGNKLGTYYNSDGTPKTDNTTFTGRGRTSCVIYGLMMTFGGENGTAVQVSPLIGKDVFTLSNKEGSGINLDNMSDLELLRKAGVSNLAVHFENIKTNPQGKVNNWECWVRSAGDSMNYDLRWGARTETTALDRNGNVLEATVLIFRSPKDGAIHTYVMDSAIEIDGKTVDFSKINSANGGKGIALQNSGNGKCNGTVTNGEGYRLLQNANINQYVRPCENDGDTGCLRKKDIVICVGSEDGFAYDNARRMIRIAAGGHNASAVVLVDQESELNQCTHGQNW